MASPAVPLVVGGFFAWSIYRRIRRNIGRQRLRRRRIFFSLSILALFSVLLIFAAFQMHNLHLLFGFGGGLILGAGLGFLGLRLTKFETTEQGHFYIPNTYIGGALSLLLVGRMLYRMWQLQSLTAAPTHPPAMQSPLTYFIVGLTFGYYIVYYLGLFIHTHDQQAVGQ